MQFDCEDVLGVKWTSDDDLLCVDSNKDYVSKKIYVFVMSFFSEQGQEN